ncbi:pollen-specific leucine-rich repeat extensin-like protein 2 [Astatotilapia calliptera]|uniref:pollen-specific leucine-rich repeat extensin-like protein 2 n=1 Tax=Astatotilapia calliptera TaxID=8154 RepID=UPI000E40A9B5|nr:pollen-specific leucine-rich repeat extensin-like protein 2 [Astatotilapia calliptera]
MDPATHNPSAELREDLIYTVEYHCQEWEALPGDEHREVVAARLQRMVSGLPWLFGALHPHIRDFLVSTVGVRPELPLQCEGSEDVQSGPLEDSRPGSSPPPSRRKRRSRRRRPNVSEQTPGVRNTSEMNSEFEYDCVSRAHNVPKFTSAPFKHETEFITPPETAVHAELKNPGTVSSMRVIPEAINSVSETATPNMDSLRPTELPGVTRHESLLAARPEAQSPPPPHSASLPIPVQSPVSPVQPPLAQSPTQPPAPQPSLPLVHSPVKSLTPLPTPLSPQPLLQPSEQPPVQTSVQPPVQTSVQPPVQTSVQPPVQTSVQLPVLVQHCSTAELAAPVGESDCESHTQPKLSGPGPHDCSTTVSNSVLPAIVLPDLDNSATVCLDSKDVIPSDTLVPNYSPTALPSDLCVPKQSGSCNARSISSELASINVSPVELAEPKTVILHQTHRHTATSIAAPQNHFTQPVRSEVSQSELSHTPPSSAQDVTVHAEEHKPPETVCSIADAPSSDCFMFQPVLSLDISDIPQPTPQLAIALSASQIVTENETCVAEQAKAVVFSVPQLERANSDAACVNSALPLPAKHKTACPVQPQLGSPEPEVSAPAGSASVSTVGSGEPLQPPLPMPVMSPPTTMLPQATACVARIKNRYC